MMKKEATMKKALKRKVNELYYYRNGVRVDGAPSEVYGDVSGLRGNATEICGDLTGLIGDISGLRGNVTGLRGNVTGLIGNLNQCELTDKERAAGVHIEDLIK
jgi:hypothetical protein